MLLDLSEIVIRHGMHVDLDVDQPGVEDPDLSFLEPLKGRLAFANGGDLVNIHGTLDMTLSIPCSRCLTEVRVPLELHVDEHFPIEEVLHPNRQPEEGEDYDPTVSSVVYLDQGKPILDLDELLRQLIIAELPIRTLCTEACEGLCPKCGGNRNQTPCTCGEERANKPLAGLAALLDDSDDGSSAD